ncbi:helicase, partial [Paenibacillus riograndensis]
MEWRSDRGDAELSVAEFAGRVARGGRVVKFRGQCRPMDPALLAQIQRAMAGMDKSQGLSFQDVLQLHLLGSSADEAAEAAAEQAEEDVARFRLEVALNAHLVKLTGQLGQRDRWPQPAVPTGLHAELRSYQQEGFAWLAFLRRFGLGAVLADDMGLGKTVQLIAYLPHLKELEEAAEADPAAGRVRQRDPPGGPSRLSLPPTVPGP